MVLASGLIAGCISRGDWAKEKIGKNISRNLKKFIYSLILDLSQRYSLYV
jgi:hypothetical protein